MTNGIRSEATLPGLLFQSHFIQIVDGVAAPTKETRHGINPADLQHNGEVPVATNKDLDRAVDAAKLAFRTWSKIPYEERKSSVLAFADATKRKLSAHFRDLLVQENGKLVCE